MKSTKRILTAALAVVLVLVTVLSLASCGSKATVKDIEKVKAAGKLVVGITEYAPMDYKDENGNWTGFDAEFAKLFAESLGVECELFVIEWDNKLFEVESGAIDCIWNGMTITPEITESCSVSDPYVENQQVVVMKKDNAAKYTDFDAMADLKFAAEAGSAGESAIIESVSKYTAVSAQSDALLEVASGSADACVIDATMAAAMTGDGTSYADLTIACELSNEEYGVAFRKGSDLCPEFNAYMKKIIADGTLKALADKYGLTLVG
ncbi:MAG: transporter substrate-binding domain-containing protein [Clostridia bacterium]|nr:transporter substrate-binding domain-containing protein [Clostridia bacterium]